MSTIPSLALIPSGVKASKVYSVLPTDGSGDFTFTRSGNATRVNKDGLIELVSSNVPRLNYPLIDGVVQGCPSLLLEPLRTNLITYSEAFDNGYWTKTGTSVPSNAISPSGDLTAFKLVEDTSSGDHRIDSQGISTTSGSKYTLSMFLKKDGDREWFKLRDFTTNAFVNINLSNGTIGNTNLTNSTQNSEYYGNGWYRVSFTFTASSSVNLRLYIGVGDNDTNYIGNGSSGVLMYGVQLEQGSYATSYIPTQGSAVTRVAETCSQTNISTNIISSSYPFTMYVESENIVGNRYAFCFLNASVANNYFNLFVDTDNIVKSESRANGLTELISSGVSLVNGQIFKAAFTMESATSGKLAVNGIIVSKTTFANQAANVNINDLLLGQLRTISDTGERLPIKDVRVYNTALTDSELQALTS